MCFARHLGWLLIALAAGNSPALGADSTTHRPQTASHHPALLVGGVPGAVAGRDTVDLVGPWASSAAVNGQFQTAAGAPAWNGWTHRDLTATVESAWHVSPYHAAGLNGHPEGNQAVWCGSLEYPACSELDPEGGYGNDYDERLDWVGAVGNPALECPVSLDAWLNHNLEPGYDFLELQVIDADGRAWPVWTTDDIAMDRHLQLSFTVPVERYDESGRIRLRWNVTSDGGWSDADCSYYGDGACQIDDIAVTLGNGGLSTFDDFEDGQLGHWRISYPPGCGDFAQLWKQLPDLDPCRVNLSPQVAFIDDGEVVPGTGGSLCISWCYGPGGFVVNSFGGLGDVWATPLHDAVVSPPLAVPAGKPGARFAFDVYVHENLSVDSAPIFYGWQVRSTADADPAALESAAWRDRAFLYYGGPVYRRAEEAISDLLVPGARWLQVRLEVQHYWVWAYWHDTSPAPYFDNVRVQAFDFEGPDLHTYAQNLAQDAFPAFGGLDLLDLGRNSVRFDRADGHADRIAVWAESLDPDAALTGPPQMHYRLLANPVFDPYRSSGQPAVGAVVGQADPADPDRFLFDLPDSNFLFPGDEIRYWFRAEEEAGGQLRASILPADTLGFSDLDPQAWRYATGFTMRALPTINQDGGELAIPPILYWDHSGDPAFRNEWHYALADNQLLRGIDYDLLCSQQPDLADSNGIGGLATAAQLEPYSTILLSGGEIGIKGLGWAGAYYEPGDDVGRLVEWLQIGSRNLLLTGDQLGRNLDAQTTGEVFLSDWIGGLYEGWDLRPSIDDQYQPGVVPAADWTQFPLPAGWVLYGICPEAAVYNAMLATGTAVSFAEFTDPDGQAQVYPYSAGLWNHVAACDADIAFLPYEFARVGTPMEDRDAKPGHAARTKLLADLLTGFGLDWIGPGEPTPVPQALDELVADCYPNPFNPTTRIAWELPRAGRVSVRLYSVRGRLVRELLNEPRPAGPGQVEWDGRAADGSPIASGTYFYEVRAGDATVRGKAMLLK